MYELPAHLIQPVMGILSIIFQGLTVQSLLA